MRRLRLFLPQMGWRLLAGGCVAFAVVGAVLPGLPTVPFLLVAAWAAKRGAPELYERLYQHSIWGPTLRDWRDQRAISRRAKRLAIGTMAASALLLWIVGTVLPVLMVISALFICVGTFILTRPVPRRPL
ncbi:DUF454 domain-containing protein [Saccharophagus sp. K07]|uniref:YbaN family protein n=1 Tax=Saccharophagus sp. K07 TaxID=2283636 RepID=UPI0016528BE3|nr:YbaN family protein [Saccharophagus sp. K07]MBC6906280.1 DUF454 domain-containing protein [Saccharophagus sp. K07]